MAEIQRKITEQGERNLVSRFIYANNDREMIVTWKLDLNDNLHVFNVRSITFARLLLIFCPQTELTTSMNVTDNHIFMYDLYRMMGIEEQADSESWFVSLTCTPLITEETLTVA